MAEVVYCWGKTRSRRWFLWDTATGRVEGRGLISKGTERPRLAGFAKRCSLRFVAIYISDDGSIVIQRGANLVTLGEHTTASITTNRCCRKLVLRNPGSPELFVRVLTIDEFFIDPTDDDFLAMLRRIVSSSASGDLAGDVWDHAATPHGPASDT